MNAANTANDDEYEAAMNTVGEYEEDVHDVYDSGEYDKEEYEAAMNTIGL